jgi:hypothetical protein
MSNEKEIAKTKSAKAIANVISSNSAISFSSSRNRSLRKGRWSVGMRRKGGFDGRARRFQEMCVQTRV